MVEVFIFLIKDLVTNIRMTVYDTLFDIHDISIKGIIILKKYDINYSERGHFEKISDREQRE